MFLSILNRSMAFCRQSKFAKGFHSNKKVGRIFTCLPSPTFSPFSLSIIWFIEPQHRGSVSVFCCHLFIWNLLLTLSVSFVLCCLPVFSIWRCDGPINKSVSHLWLDAAAAADVSLLDKLISKGTLLPNCDETESPPTTNALWMLRTAEQWRRRFLCDSAACEAASNASRTEHSVGCSRRPIWIAPTGMRLHAVARAQPCAQTGLCCPKLYSIRKRVVRFSTWNGGTVRMLLHEFNKTRTTMRYTTVTLKSCCLNHNKSRVASVSRHRKAQLAKHLRKNFSSNLEWVKFFW